MSKISKPKTCDCPPILYTKIVEWLYLNNQTFNSTSEWRKAFMNFLREELNMEKLKEGE